MKTSTKDKSIDMDAIVSKLRRTGELYRNTRGRTGIYEFLEAAYEVYWKLKKSGKIGRRKLLLRKAAELPANRQRLFSDLVLTIASKDRDRRDRHRWKRLIEAAYRCKIEPRQLKQQLHELHGVNNAIARWTIGPPPSSVLNSNGFPGFGLSRLTPRPRR